ncbi:hypothetical protein swp_1582 [Shewanella piezotolerans WP3]|uniref:Uncharacterized protein n=1 Tax=Shewanella piezotolerans (strain WP3 / JCM 13877) TaxID=225849 RepID=B8CL38_SHEPW|nr:hypothetical protein [Shewanella piezotolerans]ACJ28364.1 hypothetical protein swp_1582 [Shewanella piezotolerans WP3]
MIGYKFESNKGICFRDNQKGLFPLSPPLKQADLKPCEAYEILKASDCYFIRWDKNFDRTENQCWWHIIKDNFEPVENLPKKTRYMVKKASSTYFVQLIDKEVILNFGYDIYISAYSRYKTHERIFTKSEFLLSINSLPDNTDFFGVFENDTNQMVAFSENYIERNVCFYVTMWSTPDSMKKFSSYLLFHEMEKHYLYDLKFKYISDGTRSISHDTNIHQFLMSKFNFRKAYADLNLVYKPWFGAIVSLLYPFKWMIDNSGISILKKLSILLLQEEIRRKSMKGENL